MEGFEAPHQIADLGITFPFFVAFAVLLLDLLLGATVVPNAIVGLDHFALLRVRRFLRSRSSRLPDPLALLGLGLQVGQDRHGYTSAL